MKCPHCGAAHKPWVNPDNPRSASPGKAFLIGAFIVGIGVVNLLMQPLFQETPLEWALLAFPPLVIGTGSMLYGKRLTTDPRVTTCRSCGQQIPVKITDWN